MPTDQPSTLDKLAAIMGRVDTAGAIFLPLAGQYVHIATVGLQQLATFLDTSDADKSALDATHAEYQRRIKLAEADQASG